MTKRQRILGLALYALTAGCGQSESYVHTGTGTNPPPPSRQAVISQAMAENPDLALQLVPTAHLDPMTPPGMVAAQGVSGTSTYTVADLETNYETKFGSLSQELGVSLSTPEVVSNINFIKAQQETGHFDLLAQPILNNPVGVTAVTHQPVSYQTTVPLPEGSRIFSVSGGLLTPQGVDKTELKGVIVYFHGTTFDKSQVGSNPTGGETQLCAEVFASQGYIVVIPDYVGQGQDWRNVHPYVLYPKVTAQTAVDMLSAVAPTLEARYGFTSEDPALKLFSTGYSEGGAYSLWFHSYLSETPSLLDPRYDLVHSVGLEGAYRTSDVIYSYIFQDVSAQDGNVFSVQSQTLVNIVKPALSADAFLSYATYSLGGDYEGAFNPGFFAMKATLPIPQSVANVNGQQVDIAAAFALPATNIATEVVASALGKVANGSRYPLLDVTSSTRNSANALVSSTILQPGPLADLRAVMLAADVNLDPVAAGEVSIITLDQDSVVSPNNYDALVAEYGEKFFRTVKIDHSRLQTVSAFSGALGDGAQWVPIDHLQGLIYEFLYVLDIFNDHQP